MVVERLKEGLIEQNYKKFSEQGRMLRSRIHFFSNFLTFEA